MDAEKRLAERFGVSPDGPHFAVALTHPSYTNERLGTGPNNQRLEFLGDAVLGFIVSEELFATNPGDEGLLTRVRAQLVNAEALAAWGREIGLSDALRLGRGARAAGLADSTNVLADAVEALIAASYLDAGMEVAKRVVRDITRFGLARQQDSGGRDPKSELQERVQALGFRPPTYRVSESGGPAHCRWFAVEALLDGRVIGEGRGSSKREAERSSAHSALAEGRYVREAVAEDD